MLVTQRLFVVIVCFFCLAVLSLNCDSIFCCDSRTLVVVHSLWVCGLSNCGTQAQWDLSSSTRDRTLIPCIARQILFFFFNVFGCVQSQHTGAVACGILVHEPGIEPVLPALQGGFLTTGPPGSPPKDCFLIKLTFLIMKSLTVVIDDSIWGRICFFQRFL